MPRRSCNLSRRVIVAGGSLLILIALAGCHLPGRLLEGGAGGALEVRSLGAERIRLDGRFETAYYTNGDDVETSFYLADVPVQSLLEGDVTRARIVRVELLWNPLPGRTPTEPTATNASIRYIIIADGEVGIYGGSGFALPGGRPGDETLSINIRSASLHLLESTDGFVDLLTPAHISGRFTATLDNRQARRMHYATSQLMTDAFGRSRFVLAPSDNFSPSLP